MINVYIAFVYLHISYAADLDLNTYESSLHEQQILYTFT